MNTAASFADSSRFDLDSIDVSMADLFVMQSLAAQQVKLERMEGKAPPIEIGPILVPLRAWKRPLRILCLRRAFKVQISLVRLGRVRVRLVSIW